MAAPSSLSVYYEEEKPVEEMIASLPKAKGWVTHVYQYQGFWYSHQFLQDMIFAQKYFKAQSSDILLATNPKCGTTWLKSIAFAIKTRVALPPQSEEHPLLSLNPHALVPNIDIAIFHGYSFEKYESLPSPRLFCTHMPYSSLPKSVSSSGCKIVYLCRDPKDMFVSMWHFFDNARVPLSSLEEAFDLFCQGISFFGPYWDHVLGYYKESLESPERVLFLKYEDMQSDTLNHIKRLAEFLGYPFSLEEESKGVIEKIIQLCSFENMSNLEVNKTGKLSGLISNSTFFRKGTVGDSKNYLTAEMVERLNQITKEKFQGLEIGY